MALFQISLKTLEWAILLIEINENMGISTSRIAFLVDDQHAFKIHEAKDLQSSLEGAGQVTPVGLNEFTLVLKATSIGLIDTIFS